MKPNIIYIVILKIYNIRNIIEHRWAGLFVDAASRKGWILLLKMTTVQ